MQTPRTIWLPGVIFGLNVLTISLSGCGGGDSPVADKPIPIFNADPNNARSNITLENESEYIKKGGLRTPSKK
jgi:hypothetical protein